MHGRRGGRGWRGEWRALGGEGRGARREGGGFRAEEGGRREEGRGRREAEGVSREDGKGRREEAKGEEGARNKVGSLEKWGGGRVEGTEGVAQLAAAGQGERSPPIGWSEMVSVGELEGSLSGREAVPLSSWWYLWHAP